MLRQFRRSLSAYVSWLRLLPALKVQLSSRLLPAVVACPLCKSQRLSIFGDAATGGQWHSCGSCGSSGDLIQLAAKTWGLSLPATVSRLCGLGFEFGDLPPTLPLVQDYEEVYVNRPERLRKLWSEARQNFVQGKASVGTLLQTLQLRSNLVGQQLLNGPAQLLGAVRRKDVEAAYLPNSFVEGDRIASRGRVFYGRGWQDSLAIPYHDQPGRIRSFLFIGRKGEPEDFVFRSLHLDNTALNKLETEAGLAMHPQLLQDDNEAVIALRDPLLMIRLQQKNFGTFSRPLPLVAWHDDGRAVTLQSWQMFHGRRIVFWSPTATAEVLRQVMTTDGWLVLGREADYWQQQSPHESIRRVFKVAQPWRDAVAAWLEKAADREIEELFNSLKIRGQSTNRLLERCSAKLKNRIAVLLKQELVQNSIALGNTTILEQGDGWYAVDSRRNTSTLISDACLRIERVVHRPGRKETYYQGHVLYKGETVPFCDRREAVEKGGLRWVQEFLIGKEKGLLQYDPKWSSRAVSLATQFQPPEFLSGADAVGWDDRRMAFTLPRFTLLRNHVEPNPEGFFGEDAPGLQLKPPEILSPAEAQILTRDEPAEKTGWGVIGSLLANVLAPAFGQQPVGLALVGGGAELIGRALSPALGCRRLRLDNSRRTAELALAAEGEHRWPNYAEIPMTTLPATVARWLEAGGPIRNVLAPLDWLHAVPAQFLGTWRLLKDDASTGLPGAYTLAAHKIAPAYLAYLLNGRFDIDQSEGWLSGVFESLAGWVEGLGGSPEVVRGGLQAVLDVTPAGQADSFAELLCRLYTDGKLSFAQHGFGTTDKPTLVSHDDGSLSVPKTMLSLLPTKGRIEIDPLKITAALAGSGLLLGETDEAWGVPCTWWSGRLHSWRSVRARLLRVKT